jgi:two-component system phosphate regulon response regulator OmpR
MSTILVVDDDEQLGRSIARVVQREGHQASVSADPARAARDGAAVRPDLVIVELQPAWVGLIADLRCALETATGHCVPFVFTVGRREIYREIARAFGSGDDWLAKPFDPEELAVRVEMALRR